MIAPPRLLVVGDEESQMRDLCAQLVREGYVTRGFSSAQQALAELRPGEVDLLLTDLMMPEMDGITLIYAARQIDPMLGAIVMTGHGTIDTALQAMPAGALDYILKPFELNVILSVISRAWDLQRLRRENAELREREQRRSEELTNAHQDLESFLYSISHDLRAPLRSIDGFAHILEDDFGRQVGEEGLRIIRIIRSGCQKMDELVVGLLEFLRAGRTALHVGLIDMTVLADAAATEVRSLYTGPEPIVEIAELPAAEGDVTALRQVWSNLIGNALKYSAKQSQPLIRISGRIEGREAIYQVQDNGVGFDMRYADKLFGVFQRLHRAEEFPGTGVGLAIAQRIVVRHGGRIWAQGTPDEGACFQFALPCSVSS
jgi:two-component system sensor histidine kinase/response regulator